MRQGLASAAAAVVLAASSAAHAFDVQTQQSASRVGVGESFYVQLSVMSDTRIDSLSDARLPLPAGMSASGPSVSQQSQVSIVNGRMSPHSGVTLTWTVTANKVGTFRLGAASVTVGSERAQGRPLQVEVVAGASNGGPQRQRRAFDPFNFLDPFGGGNSPFNFKSPFDDEPSEERPEEPTYPEELRVDRAPDPIAFLRATVSPNPVVVGQQVTLRVYAYGGRGQFGLENLNEPSHADFLAFDSGPDSLKAYLVPVGGVRYVAAKLRELPLFPLRAGTLRAGNMKLGFAGRGYPKDAAGQNPQRESNWVDLVVTEPPLRGRPAGYRIGDVGNYKLSATVEPRQILAGESVSVIATLSGVGNVPFKLLTPESRGVEWLEPSTTEKMEAPNGLVQGSRTFSYVVRMSEAGTVDLADLTLPYYDPKRREYEIARATLGTIEVKPNPSVARANGAPKPDDRLAGVLRPREALAPTPGARTPLSDGKAYWAALLLAPFSVVFAGAVLNLAGRAREKLRERGSSLTAQLDVALREARNLASKDPQGSVAAVERAVFLAIELKLNFKARAVLKSELSAHLTERGLPSARAAALARILEDCDTLRFVGAAGGIDPTELAGRTSKNAEEMRSEPLSTPK